MKYVALLRGINVGGNSLIKMADLKLAFEKNGFKNVVTYINSGNVIFKSDEKDTKKITQKLEESLSKTFGFNLRIVVIPKTQLEKILDGIPKGWKTKKDIRCYIAFVKPPRTVDEIVPDFEYREGLDFVDVGPGVVYMTTLLAGITKSKFSKLASKKIYQDITIRNYNTAQKILFLMT